MLQNMTDIYVRYFISLKIHLFAELKLYISNMFRCSTLEKVNKGQFNSPLFNLHYEQLKRWTDVFDKVNW